MSEEKLKIKVLVVEDDKNFRKVLCSILKRNGFSIVEADNGRTALDVLAVDYIDIIVSDVKMPDIHGIELLHRVKRKYDIPFIMMTGFSKLIETTEAHELGASYFLAKPFIGEEVIEAIDYVLNTSHDRNSLRGDERDFMRVEIESFLTGSEFSHPVFLKLNDLKIIKIAHEGEDLTRERLKQLKSKGVDSLYIKTQDFKEFLNIKNALCEKISDSSHVSKQRKIDFYTRVEEIALRYIFKTVTNDKEVFEIALNNLLRTIKIVMDDSLAFETLMSFSKNSPSIFNHSIAVAILSVALIQKKGWESAKTLFLASAGGLFHDIGKKDLVKGIDEIEFDMMTKEQRLDYESHPELGAKILREIAFFPDEVVQIVLHHHELINGTGFPKGISRVKIHPISQYVAVADKFLNVLYGSHGEEPCSDIQEVLGQFKSVRTIYNKEAIDLLENLFSFHGKRKVS
ncbi:hypothetical protein A9Q84_01095 [Halobacteriovorax marinus]|uniref:Response regulator n=1 Tax=Halobacteriovorax marinus TaxID=97084 RepID=A0A1Y5FC01_9BACT|nr:hypothetical protein A9Q84_01095 [Halobacteriovorax marinus]